MTNNRNLLIIIGSILAIIILSCGCYFTFNLGSRFLSGGEVARDQPTSAPLISLPPTVTPSPLPTPLPTPTTVQPPTPTATQVVPDTPVPSPTPAPDQTEVVPESGPTETIPESTPPTTELQAAFVIYVVDGDSIDVVIDNVEYRVDYLLVNAPEIKEPDKPVEPFGPEAYETNKTLVEGKTVFLERDISDSEQPGQLLRYVYVDGLMVNQELLRLGLAQVAAHPPDQKYVDRFWAIQQEAQAARIGMWAG